jgi:hypothetical protein
VYNYGNNTLEIKTYQDGKLNEIEHGLLEKGNEVSINGISADSTSFWSTYYAYDANGFLIREIHMDNDTIENWRVEYQVTDGNIVSMNRINYLPLVCTYEYYPGTTNSLGSLGNMVTNMVPNMGKKNKNLIKKVLINYAYGTPGEEDDSYIYYANSLVKEEISTTGPQTIHIYFTYW